MYSKFGSTYLISPNSRPDNLAIDQIAIDDPLIKHIILFTNLIFITILTVIY